MTRLTRRDFLAAAGATLTTLSGCAIVPRHTVARSGQLPPSERLRIACIGVGGRGSGHVTSAAQNNYLVAMCDVDEVRAAQNFKLHPKIPRFTDYRKMLDKLDGDIDAVVIATPDHTHATIAMEAITRGKHVYCEKPLAHSIYEVRQLMQAAQEHNVVTQLGNQGHSTDTIRMFCEWIWDGAIGEVHTIHAGCALQNSALDQLAAVRQERPPIPATLDWQQWLGPVKERPYNPAYLPGHWRRWTAFGNGTIGDWTCHVIDPVFWALDLGAPASVQVEAKNYDPKTQGETFPAGEVMTFEFPARGKRKNPVTLKWFSGAEPIPRPAELEPGRQGPTTGAVVMGTKGTITYGSHGAASLRIIPEAKMRAYQRPEKTIPRVKGHMEDFYEAVKTGHKAGSDFSYGGPLSEIALLGVIGIKLAGQKLEWDAEAMRFTNSHEANRLVRLPYRWGWTA